MINVHASCVAMGPKGVLIRGASGSGKSNLALQLIETGARLVSDDQTCVQLVKGTLCASPPPNLAGLLEIRGLGIVKFPHKKSVVIKLVVDLKPASEINRLADPSDLQTEILGFKLHRIAIAIGNTATPTILRYALQHFA